MAICLTSAAPRWPSHRLCWSAHVFRRVFVGGGLMRGGFAIWILALPGDGVLHGRLLFAICKTKGVSLWRLWMFNVHSSDCRRPGGWLPRKSRRVNSDGRTEKLEDHDASRQKPHASIPHPSRGLYALHFVPLNSGKAPPLSKPPVMVLRLHGYGAWIESEGQSLEEYAVEVKDNVISCYVCSEEGKVRAEPYQVSCVPR